MNFNVDNIRNRTALARCCFADMMIRMMEAASNGDSDLEDCLRKKAWLLNYAISEICYFYDNKMLAKNSVNPDPANGFTNDVALDLIEIMNEYCGCPCGVSDEKVTNDTLPKYI